MLIIDLQINITPLSCFRHVKDSIDEIFEGLGGKIPEIFVDGIAVHAHRLLGKPPSNPAYICNWDFDIGMITGEVKIPFLQAINAALDSFIYHLIDMENALPEMTPPDRDITFLRVNAVGAALQIPVDAHEIRVELGPTTLGADDQTSLLRSLRSTITIQSFGVQVLQEGKAVASFNTALRVTMLGRRQDLLDHRLKQAQHVRDHDAPSRRAWFLYSKKKAHPQSGLEDVEIDLPPLAPEHVASLHSRPYIPKCPLRKGKDAVQDVNMASAFLAPEYWSWPCGDEHPGRISMPDFVDNDPKLHSSSGDIVLTHLNSLPGAQKSFIVEVSPETTLLLTPNVIHAANVLLQALDITVFYLFNYIDNRIPSHR